MASRLIVAILARNEADRYLARVISRCHQFSDAILLLDDGSTDGTMDLARSLGCVVQSRSGEMAWGAEAPARAQLWENAAQLADGGWVLVCDADMLLHGDPWPLCASWEASSWAWPLYDLWDAETTFRVDGPWAMGPQTPRPWLFRPSALTEPPVWSEKGVHCGHAPLNFPGPCFVAPDLVWHHLAYVQKTDRIAKHQQYLAQADQLTPFERNHAESILD